MIINNLYDAIECVKDAMGPKSNQLNLFILLFPALVGGAMAYLAPSIKSKWDLVFVIMYMLGFLLFVYAKYKVIKMGQLFSFGFSLMQPKDKMIYIMGYLLMIFGFFLHFFL